MRSLSLLALIVTSFSFAIADEGYIEPTSAIHHCEIIYCSGSSCARNKFILDFAAPVAGQEKVIKFQNHNYRVNVNARREQKVMYMSIFDLDKRKMRSWSNTPLALNSKFGYDLTYISPVSTSKYDDYVQVNCQKK